LTYFVAVYTNPGTSGVVTQLPFMTAVNPVSDLVAVGTSATVAYQNLLTATGNGSLPPGGGNGGGNGGGQVTTTTSTTIKTSSGGPAVIGTPGLMPAITKLTGSSSLSLVTATTVNADVWINVGSASIANVGVNGAASVVNVLIQQYGAGSAGGTLYVWTDASGSLNAGLFQVKGGVTDLYYVTITA
jgi:hypothetical protein